MKLSPFLVQYSLWVAGAVNMGIISINDLTDLAETSFAAAYAAVADDDGGDDGGSTPLPAGTVCKACAGVRSLKV